MGILVTGLLILALTSILGITYVSLPNQTKSNFKKWVNSFE